VSLQPVVTTASAASNMSFVQRFGCSVAMSMPFSAIAATAEGFTWSAGFRAAGVDG
jgi:hypothetical protein